jgi:hypothetical protein
MSGDTVKIEVTCEEVDKLLDLLGHDGATAEDWEMVALIRSLYRQRCAFADAHPPALLAIHVTQKQLDLVHRYFTPAAFGQGGREFRVKVARAFIECERLEDIPDIERIEPVTDDAEFGDEQRQQLSRWKEEQG